VRDIGSGVRLASSMVEDYLGHREVSAGAAAGAKLFSNLNDQWNNTIKGVKGDDGNWITAAGRPERSCRGGQVSRGDARARAAEVLRSLRHDAEGRAVVADACCVDAQSFLAENRRRHGHARERGGQGQPAQPDQLKRQTRHSILRISTPSIFSSGRPKPRSKRSFRKFAPNIKGTDASRLTTELVEKNREQIVKAAATAAISKSADPEKTAAEFTKRYPDYLNGADANTFAKAAKAQAKTNQLQDKQLDTYQRQQDERAAHQAANKVISDNVSFDQNTGRMVVKPGYFQGSLDIAKMANAPDGLARSMISWGEHQQAQKAETVITDPATKERLYSGLFDTTKPTSLIDLQRAQVEGKISARDYAGLHQLWSTLQETPLKHDGFKETMDAAKAALTYTMPGLPGKDPKGLSNYSAFVQQFVPEYLRQKTAGTLPANALDLNDPKSLISQAVAPYKRNPKQLIQDRVQELQGLNMTSSEPAGPAQVIPQVPGQPTFIPPQNWQWSPGRQQYRDTNGKLYDAAGKAVK
jgi:hypothetical protein